MIGSPFGVGVSGMANARREGWHSSSGIVPPTRGRPAPTPPSAPFDDIEAFEGFENVGVEVALVACSARRSEVSRWAIRDSNP